MKKKYIVMLSESYLVQEIGMSDLLKKQNFKDWWSGRARRALTTIDDAKKRLEIKKQQSPNNPALNEIETKLNFYKSEIGKMINIYNATIIGSALLGTAAITGLFYFMWKKKQKQLHDKDIPQDEINKQKETLKQQFISKIEASKGQASKLGKNIVDRLEQAKQKLLKKK